MNHRKTLLIVDDIESIRFAIADYLRSHYNVLEADNGVAAVDLLSQNPVHMVITDIRMPEMNGIDLIRHIHTHYPDVKYALMTAYNVDDYIHYARTEHIWNIIPKTTFLDLKFIGAMVQKTLSGDIFGIDKYFPEVQMETIQIQPDQKSSVVIPRFILRPGIFYKLQVSPAEDSDRISDLVGHLLVRHGAPTYIRQVVEELSSNATTRAPGIATGSDPESGTAPCRSSHSHLFPGQMQNALSVEDKSYEISFGIIEENIILSVTDFWGTIDREEILYRLERQTTIDPKTNLPIGIGDLHGRGLFISREHMDHLIFNIEPCKKTEVIAILSLQQKTRNRAISIYQQDGVDGDG